jgi:hypothetical protein
MSSTLRVGSSGPDVNKLQDILYKQGFLKTPMISNRFTAGVKDAVIYFQQTHLGPDRLPLTVDGIVGPDTWWALQHPSGKWQRSYVQPHVPEGIVGERAKVLRVAIKEHQKNVREIPNGSNRSKEIDKYFPQWLQDKLKPGEKGPAWCCFSVHWVFHEGTGRWPCGKLTGSCATMTTWAQELGIYQPAYRFTHRDSDRLILRPGDIFVILYPAKPGKPATGHTGLVGAVNEDQTRIGTYEGNCGNRYKAGLRDMGDITGVINPYVKIEDQTCSFERELPEVASVARDGTR